MKQINDEKVILVDKSDHELGYAEKLSVHRGSGQLHRAVSVLVYRKKENGLEVLLQKRAGTKPLWPSCWTNTICTHPRIAEAPIDCAVRRLGEEMGIKVNQTNLIKIDDFYYQMAFTRDLAEHEYDHVFLCQYDGQVVPSITEVSGYRWILWSDVVSEVREHPENFTGWFRLMINRDNLLSQLKSL
jgi:isopentenyl-diphosphate Delta-isomerase